MGIQIYECAESKSINACTIVPKIEKVPTITMGESWSSLALIAYALAGVRVSSLLIVSDVVL